MSTILRALARAAGPLNGSVPLTNNVLLTWFGGAKASSGMRVTDETAMSLSSVWRATTLLSGVISSVDIREMSADGQHSKNALIENPNPWFDRFTFRELQMMHLLLNGNFYAYVERGNTGIKALHPLDPSKVTPKLVTDDKTGRITERVYVVSPDKGAQYAIGAARMWHVAGPGWDGVEGKSIISLHKEMLGTILAAEKYAGRLFGNGNLMAGILTTDKRLTKEQADALKGRWREKVQGLDNSHDVAVLDAGAKFESLTIPPEEAQFIQARKFGVEEVGRLFGIPSSYLNTSSSNGEISTTVTEAETIQFVQFTINVWTARLSAAWDRLIYAPGDEQETVFVTEKLIKADTRTRASAAVMWRKAKAKSVNEIRAEEGLPRIDDPEADDPLSNLGSDGDGGQDPGTNDGNEEHLQPQNDVEVDDEVTA